MTLNYVGSRAFKTRLAEFGYEDKEEARFLKIIEKLEMQGWDIDASVENWAACEVENFEEFEMLKHDWQAARRAVK